MSQKDNTSNSPHQPDQAFAGDAQSAQQMAQKAQRQDLQMDQQAEPGGVDPAQVERKSQWQPQPRGMQQQQQTGAGQQQQGGDLPQQQGGQDATGRMRGQIGADVEGAETRQAYRADQNTQAAQLQQTNVVPGQQGVGASDLLMGTQPGVQSGKGPKDHGRG